MPLDANLHHRHNSHCPAQKRRATAVVAQREAWHIPRYSRSVRQQQLFVALPSDRVDEDPTHDDDSTAAMREGLSEHSPDLPSMAASPDHTRMYTREHNAENQHERTRLPPESHPRL